MNMNMNMRHWLNVFDDKFEAKPIEENNQATGCGDCRLYTCQECFPENYAESKKVDAYENPLSIGDYVKLSEVAGGRIGRVSKVKGDFAKVMAEDNTELLVHMSDATVLVETDDEYPLYGVPDVEVTPDEAARFEEYCDLCDACGIPKIRSRFLAAPPEVQQRAINMLKEPKNNDDPFQAPHPLRAAQMDHDRYVHQTTSKYRN